MYLDRIETQLDRIAGAAQMTQTSLKGKSSRADLEGKTRET